MKRQAIAACVAAFACAIAIGACGGRVDGGAGFSESSGSPGGATSTPGKRPSDGGRPTRPPPAPLTNAAVAASIAEDYCKAFSACCVGAAQPPIDVSRCRQLASAAIEKQLDAAGTADTSVHDATICTDAIHTRIAACGKDDVRWPGPDFPIFAPETVAVGCQPLLPAAEVAPVETCSASTACPDDPKARLQCAIDVCTPAAPVGAACSTGAGCLDTGTCLAGTCAAISTADVGSACKSNEDCRLGLVCFQNACAPTRDHSDLATRRSSPYRVGADTCRAWSYL